jgi:hypothetical protein
MPNNKDAEILKKDPAEILETKFSKSNKNLS